MAMLFIVPAVAGLTVNVPVPVGAIEIVALAGFMLNAPSSVKLTPPPPPHCKQFEPLEVLKAPPPEPEASKLVPLNFVLAVTVVPVIAAGAVPPIAGGLDKSSVPPKVKLPDVVTVPDKDIPLTVPVPPTEVTVPDPLEPFAAAVILPWASTVMLAAV
jgi:hypothetical protein